MLTVLARATWVQGSVKDQSGAGLPVAGVQVVEQGTGATYRLQSDSSGRYAKGDLPPGTYTVTAELSGFQTAATPPFELRGGQQEQRDVTLAVAGVMESVEVVAAAPLLS